MIFSERYAIAREFQKWRKKLLVTEGFKPANCAFNLITFLEIRGLLVDPDQPVIISRADGSDPPQVG